MRWVETHKEKSRIDRGQRLSVFVTEREEFLPFVGPNITVAGCKCPDRLCCDSFLLRIIDDPS